ncbi:hypothetical protein [Aliamphritea spongicola]|nr:hypothetical protein [Aliamphritea spongicola]
MKALVEPVEVIRDLKILRPLGTAAKDVNGKVKPRRSESWRSSRSLRNIEVNVATLHDLYSGQEKTASKHCSVQPAIRIWLTASKQTSFLLKKSCKPFRPQCSVPLNSR